MSCVILKTNWRFSLDLNLMVQTWVFISFLRVFYLMSCLLSCHVIPWFSLSTQNNMKLKCPFETWLSLMWTLLDIFRCSSTFPDFRHIIPRTHFVFIFVSLSLFCFLRIIICYIQDLRTFLWLILSIIIEWNNFKRNIRLWGDSENISSFTQKYPVYVCLKVPLTKLLSDWRIVGCAIKIIT